MTTQPKRRTVERHQRHPDRFGFGVVWDVNDFWADVKVYEVTSFDPDDETPSFGNVSRGQFLTLEQVEATDPYLSGFIKWDGCTELDMGCPHWCGPEFYKDHCDLLQYIYRRAFELMGCKPDHRWEDA